MINQELLAYVQKKLEEGASREEISQALIGAGWDQEDIDEVFATISGEIDTHVVPAKPSAEPAVFESTGATLSKAFHEYKRRFGTFFGIMIIPFLVGLIVAALSLFGVGMMSLNDVAPEQFFTNGPGYAVIALIFLIVVINSVAHLAVYNALAQGTGIKESYVRSFKLILSYWWAMILVGLIVMLGFMLFFIPGIIFLLWFLFVPAIVVVENKRGLNALIASREYVRGYVWKLLGKFLLFALIILGVVIVLSILVALVSLLALAVPELSFVFDMVQQLIQVLIYPLSAGFFYYSYLNLKELKGGSVDITKKKKWPFGLIAGSILGIFFLFLVPFILALVTNDPRDRGTDAAIKANINNTQSVAELYYDANGLFEGMCSDVDGVSEYIGRVESLSGSVVCNDSTSAYAISGQMVSNPLSYYCVDSTGFAGETLTELDIGDTQCPSSSN